MTTPKTMRAAVMREFGTIAIEEIDVPEPGPGEVLVRVAACGVCHSDLSAYAGRVPIPLPIVLGHEGAGTVERVGAGVSDLAPGDTVVMSITPGCGRCFHCQIGEFGLCEVGSQHSISGHLANGERRLTKGSEQLNHFIYQSSFAEYAVISRWNAVPFDPSIPFLIACLAACGVSTGYGAVVRKGAVVSGSTVLVIGLGGVGLAAVAAARSAGASVVIGVDLQQPACDLAKQLGATHTAVIRAVSELNDVVRSIVPRGVDVAIDAVGVPESVAGCFEACRKGGRTVVIGANQARSLASVPIFGFIQEKTITGSTNGSIRPFVDIPNILALYQAGRLPLDDLVTRTYPLERVTDALADVGAEPGRGVLTFDRV